MEKLNLEEYTEREEIKEKKKEFKRKYAKEEREELLKLAINEHVKQETSFTPSGIYIHNLYGVMADVTFFDEYEGKRAKLEDLKKLVEAFPPSKTYMVKGTFLSFMAEYPTDEKEKNAEITEINPYILKWAGFHQDTFISWHYEAWENEIIKIKIRLDRSVWSSLFSVDYDRKDFRGGFRIENTRLSFKRPCSLEKVTWGRGSHEYPNDFTVYSKDTETDFIDYLGER